LQAFAKQHHLTINTILQCAWGMVLGKYSGEEDIIFGTTVSGRPVDLSGSDSIIGPFINTLPVRMKLPFQSSLLSWLSEIQSEQVEFSQFTYSSLVEQYSEIPLGMPLYETMLVFENYPVGRSHQVSHQNLERHLEIGDVRSPVRTKYPLTIVSGPGSELPLSIAYDIRRFDGIDISQLLAHFRNIIEGITNNPNQPIWSISPLSQAERDQLLAGLKGARRAYDEDAYVHHRLESQADKTPDA